MLKFFRGIATSWLGPVIMGSVVVAFGILGGGVRNVLSGRIENAVVEAGSHQVTSAEFARLFDARKADYEKQTSEAFPLEEALKEGADKTLVQQLAEQTAFSEALARLGVKPSDEVVASELRREAEAGGGTPVNRMFDPVTGKFRPDELNRFLADQHLSMQEFQQGLADDIAAQDFAAALSNGYQVPRIYAAVQGALLFESRDITYFVIPTSSVPKPPPPTDAQLAALIQQYRDRLMLPERRAFTLVRFSAKALAPSMPIDPAAIQQQFEARKATYGKPEVRSVVEIPLNDPSNAAAVQAALARGESPSAVAKSVGANAIVYLNQAQSTIADQKAAAAAFAMKEGQISGPVQGDFKTVILQVTKVTPPQAPDINAARAQIQADLQHSEAVDKVYDLSQKFEDLRQGGASLADAAAKLGIPVETVAPITVEGKDPVSGQTNSTLSPKLLKTAFGLSQGGDSDVEEDTDKGEYYALHVERVIPPNPPGLDEPGVRPFLTQAYFQQVLLTALQQKATDAQKAIQGGRTFEAVATPYGAKVGHQVGLQRATAQQYVQTIGQDFVAAIFNAKSGQVFFAPAGQNAANGVVVARIDALRAADPRQIAQYLAPLQQRAADPYLKGLAGAMQTAAVRWIKPATDLDLARSAMGADKDMIARANAKPAAKGSGLAR